LHSMLPLYVGTHLGFSTTQVGSLFGVAGIFVLVMIIPAGIITDTIGRKAASVPSTAIPALAFAAFPFVRSMGMLSVLAALLGMANGLSLGSVATTAYDVIPEAKRGQFQGLRRTLGEMGGVTGPLLGGFIANTYNPGMTFLLYSPLLFLAASLLAFASRETLGNRRPMPH
ncbi:MAG TPA: MFS transporter, partial [Candidatus Binatia bacterium]